ncbi:2-dehydro-3-deoxyphosphooctonate aldolase [Advenella kashmirensis WT001]|uniref:2-dehydro-3-deoxyphosphooctonate aldolase n=1 Tax=Advenella kashmirensis (strain DSM 17095 / LMG 22695 / WT001) TaxID=1036672 RepID=I3UDR7_ADVKW|nr:2-dehydro-3-deoxyphosphooctonate aldolase [Advenella kashmirensis WT001]
MNLCGFDVGLTKPFFLIAGPCVIESRQMAFDTASALQDIAGRLVFHLSTKVRLTRPIVARAPLIADREWTKACRFWPISGRS